ncbi:MAG: hypothetical protein Q4G08_09335 [Capnocytophaga sp.]|nr:hypothetical protein [Capnocytophaga sp.]
MKRFFAYWAFIFRSTNEHGVHSPFIYTLITKGLYAKNKSKNGLFLPLRGMSAKQTALVEQIVQHLDIRTIASDRELLPKETLGNPLSCRKFDETSDATFDAILLSQTGTTLPDTILSQMHNDSILILNNPHSKTNTALWQALCEHPRTTAIVDTYLQGYVFIRREQKKELFFIRI